jgi:hypothetical protein
LSDSNSNSIDDEQDNGEVANSGPEQLYAAMGIPASCRLNKRIFKKLFHENSQLGATDKKAFKDDIDKVIWMFKLEPNSVSIPAFTDDEREYLEVAILQVDCKTQKRSGRIAQIIHRAIPYPLMLVFSYESSVLISMAHKRFSQSEKGAIVADEFHTSDWIDLTCPTDVHTSFLSSLKLSRLPHSNLFTTYSALVDCMICLECARLTGAFSVQEKKQDYALRRESLAKCHQLESEINQLKTEISKEEQFNRRVELNVKIKNLESKLTAAVSRLDD